MKQFTSLSETDKDYYCDEQQKINHVSCQFNGIECKSAISSINNNYLEFNRHHVSKNYAQSIKELRSAFYKTSELKKSDCQKCAKYFRSVVTQSLEDIHDELEKMATGIFRTKRYNQSFIEAENMLLEFKNGVHDTVIRINNQKEHNFSPKLEKLVV